ncbi:hypothetical protein Slala05_73550 [Streptomyces lavendulae subsp. lavendulae]|nr:hypothetical protein Slala05_73550 [Streptomyces lavendulae subsp. lavendulae]
MTPRGQDWRVCGSMGLLKPHHIEWLRRWPRTAPRYAGEMPRWLVCFLPVHNSDVEHVGSVRPLPEELGGGYQVVRWGRDPLRRLWTLHGKPKEGSLVDMTPPLREIRGVPVPPGQAHARKT